MTLTPAYGRSYKKQSEILKDFNQNRDFILQHLGNATLINRQQIAKSERIQFRYGPRLEKVFGHSV